MNLYEFCDVMFYLTLVLGIFFGGMLLGYSKGLFKRIKEYDNYIQQLHTTYERRLQEQWDELEGENWRREF